MFDETINSGEEAKRERDKGMASVLRAEWRTDARAAFDLLPANWEGTGEALRHALTAAGLHAPHHHNAWSAFCGILQREMLLVRTGREGFMKDTQSHGRRTAILRRP